VPGRLDASAVPFVVRAEGGGAALAAARPGVATEARGPTLPGAMVAAPCSGTKLGPSLLGLSPMLSKQECESRLQQYLRGGALRSIWAMAKEWVAGQTGHLYLPVVLRKANRQIYANTLSEGRTLTPDRRPSSLSSGALVREYPTVFTAAGTLCVHRRLNPPQWELDHCLHCEDCRPRGRVLRTCYFAEMGATLNRGWEPKPREGALEELRWTSLSTPKAIAPAERNWPNAQLFARTLSRLTEALVSEGAAAEWGSCGWRDDHVRVVINPMNVVLKGAETTHARVTYGITVVDDDSLDKANACRERDRLKPMKPRLVCDMSHSGVNAAFDSAPFRNHTLSEVTNLMVEGGWMYAIDLRSYYHHFAIGPTLQSLSAFIVKGKLYKFRVVPFGFILAPIFAQAFSSEFRLILEAKGIVTSNVMDDFAGSSTSEAAAREMVERVAGVATPLGLTMQTDKSTVGQSIQFAGVVFDANHMVIGMTRLQAESARHLIRIAIGQIDDGVESIHFQDLHSLVARLQWKSQVLLTGASHLWSLWLLVNKSRATSPSARMAAREELGWWDQVLEGWEEGATWANRPIISARLLKESPGSVLVSATDASGVAGEGGGGLWGTLDAEEHAWSAFTWEGLGLGEPESSTLAELLAVRHIVTSIVTECRTTPRATSPRVLVCVVDSSAAAYSLNKGRARGGSSRALQLTIREIMTSVQEHGLVLVAIWVPRDQNAVADILSHLCRSLSLPFSSGHSLEAAFVGGARPCRGEAATDC
jgi:hypothetical protein